MPAAWRPSCGRAWRLLCCAVPGLRPAALPPASTPIFVSVSCTAFRIAHVQACGKATDAAEPLDVMPVALLALLDIVGVLLLCRRQQSHGRCSRDYQQLLHSALCCSDSIGIRSWHAAACCTGATAAWSAAAQHYRDLVQHRFPPRSPVVSHRSWRLQFPASHRNRVTWWTL